MAYTTINKHTAHFNTKLYTGNGGSQSITGVGFQPDWIWIKKRNGAADSSIMDAVRGVRKSLTSNNSEVEYTESAGLSSFDSDGFSFDGAGFDHVNTSGDSFVAWNWKAGNSAGSSNTDGSITSTVSANTTAGFSIVKWTGDSSASATVGHGLGTIPAVIITKELNGADYWHVWHKDLTNPNNMFLNTNLAEQAPSDGTLSNVGSSTFGFQGATNVIAVNENGIDNIGYCFAEKKGFSKFGSYTGNGSTDGTFVYTGFKPAFVITKKTDSAENWYMKDNKRNEFNPVDDAVYANSSASELSNWSGATTDYLSNGFKIRTVDAAHNASGGTYIYMAFAESPIVGSNDTPATAR